MFQFNGGVQDVVVNLQKHLQKKGHKVLIITPRPRAHFDKAPKGMILIGHSTKMNSFATMVDASFEADGEEIKAMIEKEKFDILHFHEPWQPFLSRQILSRSDAVNIATFHGSAPDTRVSKSMLSMVYPYTKTIQKYLHFYTAVSEPAAEYVSTLTDAPITIIPNGIEVSKFKVPKDIKKHSKKTILYLGRLEKRKGLQYLLIAYARLREDHDDVKLIIAGNGMKRESLEKYIIQYEIPDVTFTGFVPEADKVGVLASADLFCSPSIYGESFGIILLENMALGVPIVAGNNPGYQGVMKGLGRVSLVTPAATEDFSQRLELMLYNEDIRELWKKWAKKEIQQYDFYKVADAYEEVYKKALKKYA